MKYEIDNTLTRVGNRWRFSGYLIDGTQSIPISGTVAELKTDGMIKRAIIEEAEVIMQSRQKQVKSEVKVLSEDAVFRSKLQVI